MISNTAQIDVDQVLEKGASRAIILQLRTSR